MSAELQEAVALAFVLLVAGMALFLRLRAGRARGSGAAACSGCDSSSACGGHDRTPPRPASPLTRIRA